MTDPTTPSLAVKIARRLRLARLWAEVRGIGRLCGWLGAELGSSERRRRDPRLTVAVDVAPLWEQLTGVGWYLYRLLEHLAERKDLALRLYGPDLFPGGPEPAVELPTGRALELVRRSHPPADGTLVAKIVHKTWPRLLRWISPLAIALDRNRIVFAPNYFPPRRFRLAERTGGRLVATIHDLGYRRVPWAMREETMEEFRRHLGRVWQSAELLLTDSRAVASEIAEDGLAPAWRLRPVHLAPAHPPRPADAGTAPPPGTPERFALFVGTLEPRKNVTGLVESWRRLARLAATRGEEAPALVVCGRYGWKSDRIGEAIEAAAAEGLVHRFGYVSDEELAGLYRAALFLVFPSMYEGFGLPALEAAAAGIPQVASDIPVLREVAGPGALYAPPTDLDRWAEVCAELARDPALRARLSEAGRRHAERFDWRRTAEGTARVFHEAAGRAPDTSPTAT